MAKHALHERLSSSDLCNQLKGVDGIDSALLAGGEKLAIDLDSTPALSPFIAASGVRLWQRLRAVISFPDLDAPHYGLVEARRGDNDRSLLLVALADGSRPPVVAQALGARFTADGPTWQSTIQVSPDSRFVGFEHGGAGATEIIGAATQAFQGDEHVVPLEAWVTPVEEVLYKGFSHHASRAA